MIECFFSNVSRASDFGLMKIDKKGRVISFSEKPRGEDLKAMVNFINLLIYFLCYAFLSTTPRVSACEGCE